MTTIHNLGFPRIGGKRELKSALEAYWRGDSSREELLRRGHNLRSAHWDIQKGFDYVPVGDFSYYDHVLDMSFLIGNVPQKGSEQDIEELDNYFRLARGQANESSCCSGVDALDMTKWFDTNYHYIVPELDECTRFSLNAERLVEQVKQAQLQGISAKPVVLGPLTYLYLCKAKDGVEALDYLDALLGVYQELFLSLQEQGVEWLQIDEPILVKDLDQQWKNAFERSYHRIRPARLKLLLTTYFGRLGDNLQLTCSLPVAGLHIDAIDSREEVARVLDRLGPHKILSLGVVSGRNIWKTDLNACLEFLRPIAKRLKERLWLAPSCSLLHVPMDLDSEDALDEEIKQWLAFAVQKLDEIKVLSTALKYGREAVQGELRTNASDIESRQLSSRVNKACVKNRLKFISKDMANRNSPFHERIKIQKEKISLPILPTTTIGSFPQTKEIRQCRLQYKQGNINDVQYRERMYQEIAWAIKKQEELELDVFVHGEAERNDMVEYFGEHLDGMLVTKNAWVQSYGSRCVKPPIIWGDIERKQDITVEWILYAQSLTEKPVKAMLTGPVTILNWSFVRDDLSRKQSCLQLALAIRDEVLSLEAAGVKIIQVDEAALREGLPLRRSEHQHYLSWAAQAFRLAANGVEDGTQIHTHMCYSEFNDIIDTIASLDADVITIEASRSGLDLLNSLERYVYPNDIGPGVYDIHSPNIPSVESITDVIRQANTLIPIERLWVNPDCGLKTRQWCDVLPALNNMVSAARVLRQELASR